MKKYKHIFFDLDHTLWDYDANAALALHELYDQYEISKIADCTKEQFVAQFFEVNESIWDLYNKHQIERAHIRERRFATIFDRLNIRLHIPPQQFDIEYVDLCPTKENVFEGTHDILNYLKEDYRLHIITNGFDDVQFTKMKCAKIDHYFDVVVTSENSKSRKPAPEIFELALSKSGAALYESIMIGDNLDSDILGARNFGMDHVWFNPEKKLSQIPPTYEIEALYQLRNLL
uniref:YjjG family noncanonical pyrimidine nucleotidase n=1 Tax=Roseivirga sp. TaxID=1964215 RepID=UPI00404849BD